MSLQNICKFTPPPSVGASLCATLFVHETDEETMRRPVKLTTHRMILATKGEGELLIDNDRYRIKRGSLLFIFTDETVALTLGREIQYIYIDFVGARALELFSRFDITPPTRLFEGHDGLIPLWLESLGRASDKTIDLAAESIILHSFSRLFDKSGDSAGIVSEITKITERCFSNPELSISVIADRLCYNPKYLSHLFKRKTGIVYSEYLRSVRLKYAVMLFDQGIDSVKNVALLSGFTDPLYFSKVFKDQVGSSPKEYIKNKQK